MHIEIAQNDRGGWKIVVDGIDIGRFVSACRVDFKDDKTLARFIPEVTVTLQPDAITADLPDAIAKRVARAKPLAASA